MHSSVWSTRMSVLAGEERLVDSMSSKFCSLLRYHYLDTQIPRYLDVSCEWMCSYYLRLIPPSQISLTPTFTSKPR